MTHLAMVDPHPPSPSEFSAEDEEAAEVAAAAAADTPRLLFDPALLSGLRSTADIATDPGVRLGSSSGFFMPGPFHCLPGTNSGIPKLSMSVPLVLLPPAADLPPPLPSLPWDFEESGHPEPVVVLGGPQVSSDIVVAVVVVMGGILGPPGALGNPP